MNLHGTREQFVSKSHKKHITEIAHEIQGELHMR